MTVRAYAGRCPALGIAALRGSTPTRIGASLLVVAVAIGLAASSIVWLGAATRAFGAQSSGQLGVSHRKAKKKKKPAPCIPAKRRHVKKKTGVHVSTRRKPTKKKLKKCPVKHKPVKKVVPPVVVPQSVAPPTPVVALVSSPVSGGVIPPTESPLAAPTNTTLPSVTGAVGVGDTLTADAGGWTGSPTGYAYQWQECDAKGEDCAGIDEATSSTYKLVAGDVGHTLRVVVTASNAGGSSSAPSAATVLVAASPPPAPKNATLPTISGSAVEGETLSAAHGGWTGSPTGYVYQWEDCSSAGASCVYVGGATGTTYRLVAGDVGHTLRVVVTASNAGGSSSASSAATAVVVASPPPAPTNTTLPTVSGSTVEGETLSAGHGKWTGSPTGYAYQWEDCSSAGVGCVDVGGATGTTHKLVAGDVGHTLRVVVTASNAGGSTPIPSAATAVVTAAQKQETPSDLTPPSIGGSDDVGQSLTANHGTWTEDPTSYSYQWEDCDTSGSSCTEIDGATGSSYVLVHADLGHTLRVAVRASNGSQSAPTESAATGTVEEEAVADCGKTLNASETASAIAGKIEDAKGGETLCFESGRYGQEIKVGKGSAGRSSYATLRPAAGAAPELLSLSLEGAEYLRLEKLRFVGRSVTVKQGSETGKMQEGGNVQMFGARHIEALEDSFEDGENGATLRFEYNGGKEIPTEYVTFEKDYMYNMEFGEVKDESSGEEAPWGCGTGLYRGEDIIMPDANHVTIKHNTFFLTVGHFIQGGENVSIENNLFEGYQIYECQHVNVWQLFSGSENDTFSNNIIVGKGNNESGLGPFGNGSEYAAGDGFIVENGPGSAECATKYKNIVSTNNLWIDGGSAQAYETFTIAGETITDNTVVGSQTSYVVEELQGAGCGHPTNLTFERNIGTEASPGEHVFSVDGDGSGFKCNQNVSSDGTAASCGKEFKSRWTPEWETTAWNPIKETEEGDHFPKPPAGYYIPKGLPFQAGYKGGGGP
jgi:hypothetical protein